MANTLHKLTRLDYSIIASLVVISVSLFFYANARTDFDDAYISFRYARNLAQGHGPVYNIGERIYGSTTLLWVGWLALFSKISGARVEVVSHASAMVFLASNVGVLYVLIRRAIGFRWLAVAAALLMLVSPLFLVISAAGMETMLYVFLSLSAYLAFLTRHNLMTGLLAGLVYATRPDGLAVFAAIGMMTFYRDGLAAAPSGALSARVAFLWRTSLRSLLIGFSVVAIPFAALCQCYYGSLLPQTLAAKRHHVLISGRWWMLKHFASGPGWPCLVGLLLGGFLLPFWLKRRPRDDRTTLADVWGPILLWSGLYVAAWSIVRIDMYHWYIAALGVGSALAVCWPVALLNQLFRSRLLIGVSCALLGGVGTYWSHEAYERLAQFDLYIEQYELPRLDVSQVLNANTQAGRETIGAGAIGFVGYYCPSHRILDFAGLVTPRSMLLDPKVKPTMFVAETPERKEEYRCVYMCSPVIPGPDQVLWIRRDGSSTWEAGRQPLSTPIGATFGGKVQLVSVEPLETKVKPGSILQFRILWRFLEPLPEGRLITYHLGSSEKPNAVFVEKTGFLGNRRPNFDIQPGETILDFVNIPLDPNIIPGAYELSASIYPTAGYEVDAQHVSSIHPGQCRLVNIQVIAPIAG